MENLKIVIETKIATAQENILKEEINKLFERIFMKKYTYISKRVESECPKCVNLQSNGMGTCDEHSNNMI